LKYHPETLRFLTFDSAALLPLQEANNISNKNKRTLRGG